MGFYIETSSPRNKAAWLVHNLSGTLCNRIDAIEALADGEGVIVVIHNPAFEAAAFAYSPEEFARLHQPGDLRPRGYVIVDFGEASRRSGHASETATVEPSKPTINSHPPRSLTRGVEATMAVEPSDPPTVESKPEIYPSDFRIVELTPQPGLRRYRFTRLSDRSPWPSLDGLLQIVEIGWAEWLSGTRRPGLDGRVEPSGPNERELTVYVD